MEPPKEIYLIRDAANPQKILGDIASEKPMFSDDIKYIRADLVNSNDLEEAAVDIADVLLAKTKEYALAAKADYWNGAHDGFIAGAKWQKEQMMKEAVEADVNIYRDLAAGKSWAEFVVEMPTNNLGEKVRIIIVKED